MRALVGLLLVVATPVHATDLADSVEWVHEAEGDNLMPSYAGMEVDAHKDDALAFIHARDNKHGLDLAKYDCADSVLDKVVVYRAGDTSKSLKLCLETKWKQPSLRGFVTLGKVRHTPQQVRPWLRKASNLTDVPVELMDAIILYSSGYRPGVVSELGHYGMMQLKPELLAKYGIEHGDLLHAEENIRAGALYLRAMMFETKSIKKALAYYQDGTKPFEDNGGFMPQGNRYIWFVRHTVKLYKTSQREFPMDLGIDNLVFVWTWLD